MIWFDSVDLVVKTLMHFDVCSVGDRLSIFHDVENDHVETLRHWRRHEQTDDEAVDGLTICRISSSSSSSKNIVVRLLLSKLRT